jgi:hypothetical protein
MQDVVSEANRIDRASGEDAKDALHCIHLILR